MKWVGCVGLERSSVFTHGRHLPSRAWDSHRDTSVWPPNSHCLWGPTYTSLSLSLRTCRLPLTNQDQLPIYSQSLHQPVILSSVTLPSTCSGLCLAQPVDYRPQPARLYTFLSRYILSPRWSSIPCFVTYTNHLVICILNHNMRFESVSVNIAQNPDVWCPWWYIALHVAQVAFSAPFLTFVLLSSSCHLRLLLLPLPQGIFLEQFCNNFSLFSFPSFVYTSVILFFLYRSLQFFLVRLLGLQKKILGSALL